jgi:quinolinate synthase
MLTHEVEFMRPCNLCPNMQRITLPKILDTVAYLRHEVVIGLARPDRARRSVGRIVHLKR